MLEKNAWAIVTDSGGVQKEAFFYRVPCITLREETEWVELVESGWNRLIPPFNSNEVVKGILESKEIPRAFKGNLYGDGRSTEKIVQCILEKSRNGEQ